MDFIRPITITPSLLTTTNVTETDETEWDSAAAPYALNDVRMVTTTANGASVATHKIYKSTAGSNNADPTESTTYTSSGTEVLWWDVVSSTNRYKMFNEIVQEQTERTGGIDVEITPGAYTNSLALINVDAASVDITMTSTADGVVYSESYSLVSPSGITDWYAYYFTPIERAREFVITDLPPYTDAVVDVDINDTGLAKCGALVLGNFFNIGQSLHGSQFGIIDYSVKNTSATGKITVAAGAYAKRSSVDVFCETRKTSEIGRQLTDILNVPVVWVADANNDLTIIYGYYREFNEILNDSQNSMCVLQIEGLT